MTNAPQSYHRYLLADSRDRRWGIYATSAGYVDIAPGSGYPPPGHPKKYSFRWEDGRELDEVQIHFIARGKGVFESNTIRKGTPVDTGSVFLLFPEEWHRYTPTDDTGWLEYWIGFKGEIARNILENHFFQPERPVMSAPNTSVILNHFTQAVSALQSHGTGTPRVIGSMAAVILAAIESEISCPANSLSRSENTIAEAKAMLTQHLEHDLELEDLARKLKVGYHWLRRAFKQQTGLSLHQYRLQVRISNAKRLLLNTDKTIEEIAAASGFENPYYFSHLFKSKVGDPPSSWRQSHNEQTPA